MKIGRLNLVTASVDAERLLAETGQSPAAMRGLLAGKVLASTVAGALNACLREPLDRHELAVAIEASGVDAVRERVLRIYEKEGASRGQA